MSDDRPRFTIPDNGKRPTAAEIKSAFATEADLCDLFIQDFKKIEGWTIYPETGGFDILAVWDATGHQLGVEAKLLLNAKVADQILPHDYMGHPAMGSRPPSGVAGPDFRAVIVPVLTEANEGIAKMLRILGVSVWEPSVDQGDRGRFAIYRLSFMNTITRGARAPHRHRFYDIQAADADEDRAWSYWDMAWFDWNPPTRCELPEMVPKVRAGVPAPVRLTPWKCCALKVMADLELDGFVTAQSVRARGVDARRFCATDGWLEALGGGKWGKGKIPAFDQQHPLEYAEILAKARAERAAALQLVAPAQG